MIPERIQQIVKTSAIACVLVAMCFVPYSLGASVAFAATSFWALLNLLVLTVIFRIALHPGEDKPGVGVLMLALLAKLTLLAAGFIALIVFAPYTRLQLYAIVLGVSSVLFVALLKAIGSKLSAHSASTPATVKKRGAAKV